MTGCPCWTKLIGVAVLGAVGLLAPSCAAPARTTLLKPSDLVLNTQKVVEQLAGSDFLRGREGGRATPIVISPEPLENLSDNRLSSGDQWVAISRVLLNPQMLELLRAHNARVQMPQLKSEAIARAGLTINEPPAQVAPTHLFRATLRSLARAASASGGTVASEATQRRDTFVFEYVIVEIQSRQIVWSGQSELARLAHGSLID